MGKRQQLYHKLKQCKSVLKAYGAIDIGVSMVLVIQSGKRK